MKFEKIRHNRIHEEIVHQIEEMILQQEFQPGDKLPSERNLAKLLGVSRTVIRQALAILKEKDLVDVRVGDGTYASYGTPVSVVAPLAKLLTEERKRIVDPVEARYLLEPQIARLAAERASKQDIEELEQLFTAHITKLVKEKFLPVELDTAFHRRIAETTGNSVLVNVLESTFVYVQESRSVSLSNKDSLKLSLEGHRQIVEGIRQKDGGMAYKAMQQHLDHIRSLIISSYMQE